MNKKYDVTALGELLIDFTENGISAQGNPVMEANPGGAPCNVLAILQRLGHSTAFIGKVGKDMFGDQLENALKEAGISTEGLIRDEEIHTTLAFVHTYPDGDRDFSFYRKPGADMMLKEEELNEEMLAGSRIFHFGSLSMTDEPCRSATKHAVSIARNAGAVISFDPNLREPLWDSLETAREMIDYGMRHCDILKISDNEILWYTGKDSYEEAVRELQQQYAPKLLLLSLGKEGSMAYTEKAKAFVPSFIQEHTIETTGAGDTFCGSVLHYVLEHGLVDLDETALKEMLTFANAAASIITTRRGALRVMPSPEEIRALL
jgi:fructokinase